MSAQVPEQFRTRDCVILRKGDTLTVNVTDRMVQGGWIGGQGTQYATRGLDEILVDYSDGLYAGFLLWGSDEISDRFTSMTQNQPSYGFAVIGAGGWIIMTKAYERYTYASRTGGGPLVPIVYNESDRLVFSLRGYYTKEDEWTLSGDPRAPNNYFIAFVIQSPRPQEPFDSYITLQVSI